MAPSRSGQTVPSNAKLTRIARFIPIPTEGFTHHLTVQAWHYDTSGQSCVTMRSTGDASTEDDDNFVAGLRGCSLHSNVTAFITCAETAPHDDVFPSIQVRFYEGECVKSELVIFRSSTMRTGCSALPSVWSLVEARSLSSLWPTGRS